METLCVAERLPREATEALLSLATGAPLPPLSLDLPPHVVAFDHPTPAAIPRYREPRRAGARVGGDGEQWKSPFPRSA
jgi:hypothetical protein